MLMKLTLGLTILINSVQECPLTANYFNFLRLLFILVILWDDFFLQPIKKKKKYFKFSFKIRTELQNKMKITKVGFCSFSVCFNFVDVTIRIVGCNNVSGQKPN